jgi:hypothetical protein
VDAQPDQRTLGQVLYHAGTLYRALGLPQESKVADQRALDLNIRARRVIHQATTLMALGPSPWMKVRLTKACACMSGLSKSIAACRMLRASLRRLSSPPT